MNGILKNEFDWILKDKIAEKINAVNKLLDIDKHEKKWYEKLAKELKKNYNYVRKENY